MPGSPRISAVRFALAMNSFLSSGFVARRARRPSEAPSSGTFANLADRGVDGEAPQASHAGGSGRDARDAGHR
jgi:hypothetical protein